MQEELPDEILYAQLTMNFRNQQKIMYVPNIACTILTVNNYLLLIWNINLTGYPVSLFAEPGSPSLKGIFSSIFFSRIVHHLVSILSSQWAHVKRSWDLLPLLSANLLPKSESHPGTIFLLHLYLYVTDFASYFSFLCALSSRLWVSLK